MSTPEERKFYNSKVWRAVRRQAIQRDRGLCVLCYAEGTIKTADEVDHKIPIKSNPRLALVLDNLQSLCAHCHRSKTAGDAKGNPPICVSCGFFVGACPLCLGDKSV